MRRGTHPRSAAGWALGIALVLLTPPAVAADWPPPWTWTRPWSWATPSDPKMAEVVAALRVDEARFDDVEYVARITVRDPQRQDRTAPSEVTTVARNRVVFQGGRTYLRHEAFERIQAIKYRHEETSACDGERTRTVVSGNCANIHLGRWRHPLLFPAHSLPMAHEEVNFPLSIYLAGTRAIHEYLEYPPGLADLVAWQTFRKVESRLVGEETIDGQRCLKIRVDRWFQTNQPPMTRTLWLAPGRNHHCIREERLWRNQRTEMRVHELREVRPGTWFPTRISVVASQLLDGNALKPFVERRTETTVEEVSLSPRHDDAFFRDVTIPEGLPVFTIRDRRLVGSMLPEPFDDDWGRRNLARLAARVAEQERRYDNTEVRSRKVTRNPRSVLNAQNLGFDTMAEERSIVRGRFAYLATQQKMAQPGGWQETMMQLYADDGEWTRSLWRQGGRDNPQGVGVTLQRGGLKGARGYAMHRPHRLMVRDNWNIGWLSEQLAPGPETIANGMPFRFRYCGASEVDGHPCVEVRGDPPQGPVNGGFSIVLDLATDRNDIPIRMGMSMNYADRWQLPTAMARCGDFREIAPGVWYPFRLTEFTFDNWALPARGWLLLQTHAETTVESAGSAAGIGDAVFREVRVPGGTTMRLSDESGQLIAQVQQPEDGIPWISLKHYLELSATRPANPGFPMMMGRRPADPAIGRPAPEFPRGARWLGGGPPAREALRGRVVVLLAWAEWSEASREAMEAIDRFHRECGKDGPAIIGVHPPGSEPDDILRVIDAMKPGFPTCVDVEVPEAAKVWGELLGGLGVRSVPIAFLIDRDGKIAARGSAAEIVEKARELSKKGR